MVQITGDTSLRQGQRHPKHAGLSGLSICGMRSIEEASCLNVFREAQAEAEASDASLWTQRARGGGVFLPKAL
ncbi:hypothetical protein CgunFtcFv8_010918 [Champsocephalus gunnari]|uniref:Uncharacterized protein n=1 Tax=Champsocephalus gunnari TaxID=52237 RepID=A0AAN8DV74_CHAGU|nr:hypothetical protein CgunFtcFv8_010918 [Champsocephalus gunnari]